MTILFFSRLFYPHIGGVEKHVLEIGKRLVKKGHKVIVITEETTLKNKTSRLVPLSGTRSKNKIPVYQSKNTSAKLTGEVEGIEIYGIPVGRIDFFSFGKLRINIKKFRIWWELWKLKFIIQSADIVHCHDVFFWYLPFRFLYWKKPVYTTFHGYESYPIKKTAVILRKISEKLSFGNICIGDYIKKWYHAKPTFATYGGVDVIQNYLAKRDLAPQDNSKPKILFIGRLDEQTGIKMYCDAVRMIKKKFPDIEFTIAGDGPLRKSAEKYGKVLGFISQPEKLFSDYRFAFVSRYLSILEALAAKRLVFAVYDNPVKRDYLLLSPFSRFIVSAESAKQLADKFIWFINHPVDERKIIENGFEFAKKQTWDNVVRLYLKLWSSN